MTVFQHEQESLTVREIEGLVSRLGACFDPSVLEATRKIYGPLIATESGLAVERDVRYGPHERNLLDLYGTGLKGPVVVFVHGGGFSGGDKRMDNLFYSNVGYALAGRGIQTVLANYRLTPEAVWPSGIEDIAKIVAWANSQLDCTSLGRPLVLVAQSAGASHAAGYIFGDSTFSEAVSSLAGCALLSGLYRMEDVDLAGAASYFGEAQGTRAARSPIRSVRKIPFPVLLTVSEFDPGDFACHSYELAKALARANGVGPRFSWLRGHNHVSTVLGIGSPQDDVLDTLCEFVERCAGTKVLA